MQSAVTHPGISTSPKLCVVWNTSPEHGRFSAHLQRIDIYCSCESHTNIEQFRVGTELRDRRVTFASVRHCVWLGQNGKNCKQRWGSIQSPWSSLEFTVSSGIFACRKIEDSFAEHHDVKAQGSFNGPDRPQNSLIRWIRWRVEIVRNPMKESVLYSNLGSWIKGDKLWSIETWRWLNTSYIILPRLRCNAAHSTFAWQKRKCNLPWDLPSCGGSKHLHERWESKQKWSKSFQICHF